MKAFDFRGIYQFIRERLSPVLVFVTLSGALTRAEDEIPHAWPRQRYEKMMEQCPFALAAHVVPVPEAQPSFAANWFVSGIGKLDGEDFVTIKARDLSTQFSLYGHETNLENGVCLAGVTWSEKIGKSTVIIKKGTETAKLEFNEAEVMGSVRVIPGVGITGTPAKISPTATTPTRAIQGQATGSVPAPNPAGSISPPPSMNPLPGQNRRLIRPIGH